MRPERLDHVALYVSDPERAAAQLRARLPFRVLERTDRFVLVGRAPELGKLTLFAAPGPREQGLLAGIAIGVPCGGERVPVELDEGLPLELVPAPPDAEVDIREVALRVPDPEASARAWRALGLREATAGPEGEPRLRVGEAFLVLRRGAAPAAERPLLNHVGLLVSSVEEARREARARELEVERDVDAPSSRALFVRGPDGVEVEYIEHKPSFALA
ncbi:MAG TPA: VOC family protein [Gaiellaceae bacterium]|nr:VOC family protein [Gaiellaceae bacterium]